MPASLRHPTLRAVKEYGTLQCSDSDTRMQSQDGRTLCRSWGELNVNGSDRASLRLDSGHHCPERGLTVCYDQYSHPW